MKTGSPTHCPDLSNISFVIQHSSLDGNNYENSKKGSKNTAIKQLKAGSALSNKCAKSITEERIGLKKMMVVVDDDRWSYHPYLGKVRPIFKYLSLIRIV